jgi:thiol-disulfide isomerase/thioredoxin
MVTFSACALACILSGAGADNLSGAERVVLMEFTADWCGACRSAQPTVQRLIADGYPVQPVNIDHEPQLAAQYRVRSVPCFVLVVGGQEVDRVLGAASYSRLTDMLERAGKSANRSSQIAKNSVAPAIRAQSPDESPRFGLPRPLANLTKSLGNRGARRQAEAESNPVQIDTSNQQQLTAGGAANASTTPSASLASSTAASTSADVSSPLSGAVNLGMIQQAMRATVRLRIEDGKGHSLGTGTIIDSHGSEALVVTCGHIFRESQGGGRILVDVFAHQQPLTVEGTLISYDLDRDIALIAITPNAAVSPMRVAPAGFPLAAGQPVFSIGCDKGANPSPRESRITTIDRYVGLPNLEVAGMPVDGRSGGGLFSADGHLIGICNAADPENQEGIFASLPIIQWELDKVGQRKIYDSQPMMLASTPRTTRAADVNANRQNPAAVQTSPSFAGRELASASSMTREMQGANMFIDPSTKSRNASDDTEVICIVRSRSNPQVSQQLMVLDRPSPELIERLRSESQPRAIAEVAAHDRFIPQTPTIRAQSNDSR